MEDFLEQAQDAYFEWNLPLVISLCQSALSLSTNQADIYDLLGMSQFQSDPPNYSESLQTSLLWHKSCGESFKQLMLQIKSAYFCDNLEHFVSGAKLLFNSFPEELVAISIVAALSCDLGEQSLVQQMSKIQCDKAEFVGESSIWRKIQSQLAWSLSKEDPSRARSLFSELAIPEDPEIQKRLRDHILQSLSPEEQEYFNIEEEPNGGLIGLSFALWSLMELESNDVQKAEEVLEMARKSSVGQDENIFGVQMYSSFLKGQFSSDESRDLTKRLCLNSSLCLLIKKRLEKNISNLFQKLQSN